MEEEKKIKVESENESDKDYMLKDINLSIRKGTMVALIGE